ncbi:AraC family transcriptional regulator [Pseudomonas sp. NPDC087614]|uniref:AraC family transcriptional regulator n=1 Tax=Pseudomonas sp. NPDC087614 TaxID=3364442 RepID=UPI0038040F39
MKEQTSVYHLEAFGGLDLLQARYYKQNFSRHAHETFCIGVIEEGAQRFYRTGGDHVAPKGDIILVNADDVHTGSSGMDSGWSYRAIYPHPNLLCSLSRDFSKPEGSIPWFPDAVIHDPGLATQLLMVFNLLTQEGNGLLKETLLLSSLAWLTMRHGKTKTIGNDFQHAETNMVMLKDFMDSYPERDVSLMQLADMAKLSPWHFLRQFKKTVGITPHAYLVQARLRKSKNLLLQGISISNVATLCGFSDQSHFHRHFKNAMGFTPGEYAHSARKS